jgi:hypothetical protein
MKNLYGNYFLLREEQTDENNGGGQLTDEQVAAAFSSPVDSEENTVKPETKPKNEPPANTPADPGFKPSPMWDYFTSDEGFKLPDGITKDNEKQLLEQQLKTKYGTKPTLHPLAQQIQDMSEKNPNIDINDLIGGVQQDFIDLKGKTVDEKIAIHLYSHYGQYDEKENPEGLTDDDIKDYISKLNKIERTELAKQIEDNVKKYNDELLKSYDEKRKSEFLANYDKTVELNNKFVSEIETKISNVNSLFGISVSPEDKKAFIEEFRSFITPDKETMERPIDKLLSDDVTLFKLFVIAAKFGEEKVIEHITKGKESAKEEIFRKLKLTPEFSGSREENIQSDDSVLNAFKIAANITK